MRFHSSRTFPFRPGRHGCKAGLPVRLPGIAPPPVRFAHATALHRVSVGRGVRRFEYCDFQSSRQRLPVQRAVTLHGGRGHDKSDQHKLFGCHLDFHKLSLPEQSKAVSEYIPYVKLF